MLSPTAEAVGGGAAARAVAPSSNQNPEDTTQPGFASRVWSGVTYPFRLAGRLLWDLGVGIVNVGSSIIGAVVSVVTSPFRMVGRMLVGSDSTQQTQGTAPPATAPVQGQQNTSNFRAAVNSVISFPGRVLGHIADSGRALLGWETSGEKAARVALDAEAERASTANAGLATARAALVIADTTITSLRSEVQHLQQATAPTSLREEVQHLQQATAPKHLNFAQRAARNMDVLHLFFPANPAAASASNALATITTVVVEQPARFARPAATPQS